MSENNENMSVSFMREEGIINNQKINIMKNEINNGEMVWKGEGGTEQSW